MSSPANTFPGLYIPLHKRNRSTSSSYSGTSLSSRGSSPLRATPYHGVYTPAELLSLARSSLVLASGADIGPKLRAVAPEVLLTRKQRKSLEWHARHPQTPGDTMKRGRSPQGHSASESEDDKTTWRRTE